jgi:predicted transcriptional regulator
VAYRQVWKVPMADQDVKSFFDAPLDAAEEARLDAIAEAEIDAGKGIPHAKVRAWLESWGKPNELPFPLPPK